jgi:schlafen family protein
MKRAYYQDNIYNFLETSQEEILGTLANNHHFALDLMQKNAWIEQIANLKGQLSGFHDGDVFFEFSIPRMGKRVDVLLLIYGVIFVLEYKAGAKKHERHAIDQVLDYALDLKNFHEGSHYKYIAPVLVSTKSTEQKNSISWFKDNIALPLFSNGTDLRRIIQQALTEIPRKEGLDADEWADSGYKPTPTIVEAAQALYQGHSVSEISRSDAGAKNLTHTSDCISEIIEHSKKHGKKSICFITGVPGAGKTLAGLNISTRKVDESTEEHAVFLSGNGPLVAVLREALAKDEVARTKAQEKSITKKEAKQKVSAFIQNIHHFRDEGLKSEAAPIEHVVVFDEAQRAWNQAQTEKFMVQRKGAAEFEMSEPEFLISLMDRKQDWCTIVCLIGGGQEINTGEAGLIEWFNALEKRFRHWDIYHSGQLKNKNYSWGENLRSKLAQFNSVVKESLHLAISIRSYRAEKLSDFVGAIIDGNAEQAKNIYSFLDAYPLAITRDLNEARAWLRQQARGTERFGLVASSGAIRLKPQGITIKSKLDPVHWFLNGKEDIRSSYFLEDVATEFDIQGLELDWTGVCWDADLRMENGSWGLYAFRGTKWQNVNDKYRRVYLANAYRVLLTRARQGMVIFVPKGDEQDFTRPPKFYNKTYQFLLSCGIKEL